MTTVPASSGARPGPPGFPDPPAAPSATPSGPAEAGLRERKKLRTRLAIRHAAYRLFAEQGYEATRVDQIAQAAEVSPSTVFRYFPTKEDIVLGDAEDPVLEQALRARPPGEPPLTALRAAFRTAAGRANASPETMAEIRQRMVLAATVPAIRARLDESMAASGRTLAAALAPRVGGSPDDLESRVLVAAVLSGLREALLYWVSHAPQEELPEVIDRAIDVLEHRLR